MYEFCTCGHLSWITLHLSIEKYICDCDENADNSTVNEI